MSTPSNRRALNQAGRTDGPDLHAKNGRLGHDGRGRTSNRMTQATSSSQPGCWLSRLIARKQVTEERQSVPLVSFEESAQSALDQESASTASTGKRVGSLTREGLTLADLKPGECGYVGRLVGTAQGRLRLLEMGLTPGTHVKVLRAAAFGGPLDVLVRGYQLSLRREEAAFVWLGSASGTV